VVVSSIVIPEAVSLSSLRFQASHKTGCKETQGMSLLTTTSAKRLDQDLRHCITLLPVIVCSCTAVVTAQTSCSTVS